MGEDGTAVGRVLRIKVVIDIRKPLMRGMKKGNFNNSRGACVSFQRRNEERDRRSEGTRVQNSVVLGSVVGLVAGAPMITEVIIGVHLGLEVTC